MSFKYFRKMTEGKIVEGVFALNKPQGITSAQALRELQTRFNRSELFAPWLAAETANRARERLSQQQRRRQKQVQVKIGHGGTLDPLATGVLIAGIGKGTKVLQSFLECTKTYDAVVLFGAATDTYDRTGRILRRGGHRHLTRDMVEGALAPFRGRIMQLPPLYSALKMDGKPLYEYAREGKEIPREIPMREVEVVQLELLEWMEGGTHGHRLPEEEAGAAEKGVAEKLWENERKQDLKEEQKEQKEEAKPPREPVDAADALAMRKRKLEQNQDALVSDRPRSKKHQSSAAGSDAELTMSGGLGPGQEPDDNTPAPASDKPAAAAADSTAAEDGAANAAAANDDKATGGRAEAAAAPASDGGATGPPPAARIRMTVTSGFYVRSLCHDLGEALGSQACMAELTRTRQGDFELGRNVLEFEELARGEEHWGPRVGGMLAGWTREPKPGPGKAAAAAKAEAEGRAAERSPSREGRKS